MLLLITWQLSKVSTTAAAECSRHWLPFSIYVAPSYCDSCLNSYHRTCVGRPGRVYCLAYVSWLLVAWRPSQVSSMVAVDICSAYSFVLSTTPPVEAAASMAYRSCTNRPGCVYCLALFSLLPVTGYITSLVSSTAAAECMQRLRCCLFDDSYCRAWFCFYGSVLTPADLAVSIGYRLLSSSAIFAVAGDYLTYITCFFRGGCRKHRALIVSSFQWLLL